MVSRLLRQPRLAVGELNFQYLYGDLDENARWKKVLLYSVLTSLRTFTRPNCGGAVVGPVGCRREEGLRAWTWPTGPI